MKLNSPLVSIIIPHFNRAHLISETIDSIIKQTYQNWEAIIVDDGSTDKSEKLIDNFVKTDSRIRFIKRTRLPKGAQTCRNIGLEQATGDYIQFLDSDDLLHPNKIEDQVFIFENSPDGSIASGKIKLFLTSTANAYSISSKLYKSFSPVDFLTTSLSQRAFLGNFCFLVPRKVIAKAGCWDESLIRNQDGEYFCRVVLNASEIVFVPTSIGYYRKGIANSISAKRDYYTFTSALKSYSLIEKHLLNFENTVETRKACADLYQGFICFLYPNFPNLISIAEEQVKRLGGSKLKPLGSRYSFLLSYIVGWKLAKKIEIFVYKHGFNFMALKAHI